MKSRTIQITRGLALAGLSLVGVMGIVASGGGGGGGTEETTFGATSAGVASKGIIQHGLVTAEELDSSGNPLRTVGSAETDTAGKYSLSIGSTYAGGPLLLTIQGKSDNTTKMKCDVAAGCGGGVAFGGTVDLDSTFSMSAIVPPVANGASISAQITPYTYMAAKRALAQSPVDADTVKKAISEVNQMVGVNILEVPPVDITDPTQLANASSEAKAYAAFLAAAGKLALDQGDLKAGIDALASAFDDGVLDDGDTVKPSDLLAAVQAEASAEGLDTDPLLSQVLATVQAGISGDCSTGPCSYDPEPADTATQTNVAKARAVVAQTRAWVTSLENLESPLDAFDVNLETAGNVLDTNSLQLGDTLGFVLDAVGAKLDTEGQAGSLSLTTYTVNVEDNTGTSPVNLGQATVTLSDNNGLNLAITANNLGGVNVSLNAVSDLSANAALAYFNTGTAMSLSGLDLNLTGSVSNANASMTLDQMHLVSTLDQQLNVDPNATTADPVFTDLSLSGGMTLQANGSTFTGDAGVVFVALDNNLQSAINDASFAKISLSQVTLNGTISDGNGNSFDADTSLTVNNAAAFDTLGGLACGEDEWVSASVVGDVIGAANYVASDSTLGLAGLGFAAYSSWDDTTTLVGPDATNPTQITTVTITGDALGVSSHILGNLSVFDRDCGMTPVGTRNVSYAYLSPSAPTTPAGYNVQPGETYLSAELDYPQFESAGVNNFADVTLSLTMDLVLSGYPDTTAVITGNRTAYKGGDLTVTLTHNGQNVTFTATKADAATDGQGTLTVTTPDGAELTVTATEHATSGSMKVGAAVVATIEETSNGLLLVRYEDGTFETLQ